MGFFIVVIVVNMRNFCVNLVMLLMQEDRRSILLISFHSFLYFSDNGWVSGVFQCLYSRVEMERFS